MISLTMTFSLSLESSLPIKAQSFQAEVFSFGTYMICLSLATMPPFHVCFQNGNIDIRSSYWIVSLPRADIDITNARRLMDISTPSRHRPFRYRILLIMTEYVDDTGKL